MDISQTYLSAYDSELGQLEGESLNNSNKKPCATRYGGQKRLKNKALLLLTNELCPPKQPDMNSYPRVTTILLPVSVLDPNKTMIEPDAKFMQFKIRPASVECHEILAEVQRVFDQYGDGTEEAQQLISRLTEETYQNLSKRIPAFNPRVVLYPKMTEAEEELLLAEERKEEVAETEHQRQSGFVFASNKQLSVYESGVEMLRRRELQCEKAQEDKCSFSFTPEINKDGCTDYLKLSSSVPTNETKRKKKFIETLEEGDITNLEQEQCNERRILPTFDELETKERQTMLQEISARKQVIRDQTQKEKLYVEEKYSFIPEITEAGHNFINDVKSFTRRFEIKSSEANSRRQMTNASSLEKRMADYTFTPKIEWNDRYLATTKAENEGTTVVERMMIDAEVRREMAALKEQERAYELKQADELACSASRARNSERSKDLPLYMSLNSYDYKDREQGKERVQLLYSQDIDQKGQAKPFVCDTHV